MAKLIVGVRLKFWPLFFGGGQVFVVHDHADNKFSMKIKSINPSLKRHPTAVRLLIDKLAHYPQGHQEQRAGCGLAAGHCAGSGNMSKKTPISLFLKAHGQSGNGPVQPHVVTSATGMSGNFRAANRYCRSS